MVCENYGEGRGGGRTFQNCLKQCCLRIVARFSFCDLTLCLPVFANSWIISKRDGETFVPGVTMSFVLYVKQPLPSTPPFKLGSICIFQRYYGPLWIIIVAMVIGQVVTMRLHYKQVEALTCSDHLILSCIYSRPKRCYSVNATHRKWR